MGVGKICLFNYFLDLSSNISVIKPGEIAEIETAWNNSAMKLEKTLQLNQEKLCNRTRRKKRNWNLEKNLQLNQEKTLEYNL